MTAYEQVKVSDLEVGDTVRFAGLGWQLVDRTCGDGFARFLCDAGGNRLTRLPNEATVERKVEPKIKQFLVTCEERDLARGDSYITTEEKSIYTDADGYGGTAWVVTKVEEQTP